MRILARSCAAPLLAVLCLAAPASARAQASLQSCVPNVSGDLPIGVPGDPGHAWKQTIVDWLTPHGEADFTWVEPLEIVDPVQAYGAGSSPNGNPCAFGTQVTPAPWPGVGPTEHLHIEQYWLLAASGFPMPWSWFNHGESTYTLAKMKDLTNCRVETPSLAWGDSLAFFANWQYAGNPFRPGTANSQVLKRRLAAWLGLQLVMLDYAHWGGQGTFHPPAFVGQYQHPPAGLSMWNDMTIGAELAGQLAMLSWTFGHVRDVLDPITDQAMQVALKTYAERVNLWNPYFPQINRGIRATYGLRYTWEVTQDQNVWQWYQKALRQFFDPTHGNWIPGGYWRDDYGLDLGYGGANLIAANRVLSEDPGVPAFVRDAVETSQDLIAHLAVPDIDGHWVAPTPFNSRTSIGSIRGVAPHVREGYYGGLERYLLGYDASLPYAAATLRDVYVLGPQGNLPLDPRAPDFHENLACMGAGYNVYLNLALDVVPPDGGQAHWPDITRSQDFGPPPTFIENHHLGLLVDLWDQLDVAPADALMPVEESGTAIRNFADRFVYGRFGKDGSGLEYAAVLHLGEVGQLPSGAESGFGGGQIAYFWSEDGGPTLLGRRKGRNTGNQAADDDWAEWRTFPLHSVFLRTAAGNLASSSLIVAPQTSVFTLAQPPAPAAVPAALAGTGGWASPPTVPESQATAVLARVKAQIPTLGHPEANGAPVQALLQPIDYRRSFLMSKDGLWVESQLGKSHASELVTEAWEMFPIWGRDTQAQPGIGDTLVTLYSTSQGAVDGTYGTGGPVEDVYLVEIRRDAGDVKIYFDHPRLAQVGDLWQLGTRESRTLMVDRLPPGCALGPGCAVVNETFQYLIQEH